MMRIFYLSEEAAHALFDGAIPVAFAQRPDVALDPDRVVQRWVEDTCITGPGHVSSTVELYDCFKQWIGSQQAPALPPSVFTKTLARLGFRPGLYRNARSVFRGFDEIALHPRNQEAPDIKDLLGLGGLFSPNGTPMTPNKEQTLAFKVSRWLADCDIETGNGLSAFVSEMHASFTKWCDESDESPVGVRPFMRHIHSLGFIPRRTPNGLVFTGIGFPEHDDEDADNQGDGDPEDKAIIAFFQQWLNQMEKLPGHTVNEDKLYMCYHRYCLYYNEVPMTLIGFRAAMATTGAPPEDVPFVNADLKEYIGIKVPVQFMFRMYGEMPF